MQSVDNRNKEILLNVWVQTREKREENKIVGINENIMLNYGKLTENYQIRKYSIEKQNI